MMYQDVKKKITLIGPTYPFRGGVSQHTTLLCHYLRQRFKVDFISFKRQYPAILFPGKSDKDPSQDADRETCQYILDSINPFTWLRTAQNIYSNQSNLLVIVWWVPFFAVMWWVIIRIVKAHLKIPVLFICHNVFPHEKSFFWSILSPLLMALVLYFVFRNLYRQEENFAINLLVGIMAWRFFVTGTTLSLSAIVGKPSLVTKVYIPRQILVLSTVLANLVGSLLEFLILVPIIFVLIGNLPLTILLFPVIHILYFWLIFGIGLFLSALFVYFRDLNQIWEVLTSVLFFMSPIIYPMSIVPDGLITYYLLNPITALIIIYRDVMVNGSLPAFSNLIVVIGLGAAIFIIGSFIFSRLQRRFAEAI